LCYYTSRMACPFFEPVQPRSRFLEPGTATLPLGDLWTGICRAHAAEPFAPDGFPLHHCCNIGYARERCDRFPLDGECPDAARFMIQRDGNAGIAVRYVLERDYRPFGDGSLTWSREQGNFAAPCAPALLLQQAAAYVQSYLRRKAEACAR
jgi:hypothetical protein